MDLVAAEDTRHARKLFNRYGIRTRLVSYYGPREEIKGEEILVELRSGKSVALISDAGTPGISDPGHFLVKKAIEEGFDVLTVPGPSAILSALVLSGLPSARFVFEGFLPPKGGTRRKRLDTLKDEERTIILYESPRRVLKTLGDLMEVLGDREAALARELTKVHEEVLRGRLSDLAGIVEEMGVKGEITLVIAGAPGKRKVSAAEVDRAVREVLERGLSARDAAGEVSRMMGIPKSRAYREILKIKEGEER